MTSTNVNKIVETVNKNFSSGVVNSNNKKLITAEKLQQVINATIETLEKHNINISSQEIIEAKKILENTHLIKAEPGQCIVFSPYDTNWYIRKAEENSISSFFWNRYKRHLINNLSFTPNSVLKLSTETLDKLIMGNLLDPQQKRQEPYFNRGLIIGDVQSGKTSTYLGMLCKAADIGYKVFIVLTGTIESLRKQTQERIEEGFIGISSNDKQLVGVGLDNQGILVKTYTTRDSDFKADVSNLEEGLSNSKAVIFVLKKQKDVLTKLKKWLIEKNSCEEENKIKYPMLLIDDEADNASINTNDENENPTKINALIRKICNLFYTANYVGFTATPYANVFIAPENKDLMVEQDLFPENFIVTLDAPKEYIGAKEMFSKEGKYHSSLEYITDAGINENEGHSFFFKHKKTWKGKLPASLTDAIYSFYIANAIRDLKGDTDTHRSMLVNISRFINVQKYTKKVLNQIHEDALSSVQYNLSNELETSMKDPNLNKIYKIWEKYFKDKTDYNHTWDDIVSILYNSIKDIKILVVNSSKTSEKLIYEKKKYIRVIAIGGLALSRGLTLEGLIISYFFRNTCTYDVLMQMGRWFGYRRGYERIFRIWIYKQSVKWYCKIAEATEQLKIDIKKMRQRHALPKEFGIRIRNDAEELKITAQNKMRFTKEESGILSFYGELFNTPYLHADPKINLQNYKTVISTISKLKEKGFKFERKKYKDIPKQYIALKIPKNDVISFINELEISDYNTKFDKKQLIELIKKDTSNKLDFFDIGLIEGRKGENHDYVKVDAIPENEIYLAERTSYINKDKLALSKNGQLEGPSDTRIGIENTKDRSADDIIETAKQKYINIYNKKHPNEPFNKNKTIPAKTWFEFVSNRRPLLLIYLVKVKQNEKDPQDEIKQYLYEMNGTPSVAISLGIPTDGRKKEIIKYQVNTQYNWFELQDIVQDEAREE